MNEYKLREIIEIHNGKDYKHLNHGHIPVYGSGGVMTYVDTALFNGESILLPRKGTLDNIMYVDGEFWTVDTMYWATVKASFAYPKYVYLYLTLLDLSSKDSGSTLPSMTYDSYYDVPIKLPDYDTQVKNADAIFVLTNKIDNNNKISVELESLAKTVYDYWFLQFDFPNEEGKPYKSSGGKMVYNEELKREIPEGWEIKELLSLCTWQSASQPPKSEFVYQPKEGYVRFIQNRDFESDANITYIPLRASTKTSNRYDILIDKYGDKTAGTLRCGLDGAFNVALGKLVVNLDNAQEYIRNYLSTQEMFYYLHNACLASTRSSLNETVLTGILVPIPLYSLRARYEEYNKMLLDKIFAIRKENKELASLRDWLLPMLMNGQISFVEN